MKFGNDISYLMTLPTVNSVMSNDCIIDENELGGSLKEAIVI